MVLAVGRKDLLYLLPSYIQMKKLWCLKRPPPADLKKPLTEDTLFTEFIHNCEEDAQSCPIRLSLCIAFFFVQSAEELQNSSQNTANRFQFARFF